jgi:hypothetical protein
MQDARRDAHRFGAGRRLDKPQAVATAAFCKSIVVTGGALSYHTF